MSDELSQVLAAINGRFDQVDRRFAALEARIGHMDERIGRIEEEVIRLRVEVMLRLDRQQDTLTGIKDDINVNVAATDNVRERHTQIRNDYDQLAHQVSLVHRRLMQLEQRFDSKEHGA